MTKTRIRSHHTYRSGVGVVVVYADNIVDDNVGEDGSN
jgi:hypothetical protein